MKKFHILSVLATSILLAGVTTAGAQTLPMAHGADIGWLSQLESWGVTWVDADRNKTDCIQLLKTLGVDAVRLRVMVNPAPNGSAGFTDTDRVVALAKRCADQGLTRLMIDFHFSDTWADPQKQFPPAAWTNAQDITTMAGYLSAHVTSVLTALKSAGLSPEWVQLGNEETQGILWTGNPKTSGFVKDNTGWSNLATLLNAGYQAVKQVAPGAQVIVHLDKGGRNELYRWWFDSYKAAGGQWDVIGLSFYPYWQPSDSVKMLKDNLNDLVVRYGKPVMVCEVGGPYSDPDQTKDLLDGVKAAVASVPEGKGLGVFYWEPESNPDFSGGYRLGATRKVGGTSLQFTEALKGY